MSLLGMSGSQVFVLMIIFIVIGIPVIFGTSSGKKKRKKQDEAEFDKIDAHMRGLEKRIEHLEAIVIDRELDYGKKIDKELR